MIPDSTMAKAISKMVDKPFCLGDLSGESGWDCLNSIVSFYSELGFTFPEVFEGYNLKNYPEKWEDDSEKSREVMFRFLMSLGKSVDIRYRLRGDLLILEGGVEKPLEEKLIAKVLGKLGTKFPSFVKEMRKVLQSKKLLIFPAIYIGNGNIFMVITTDKDKRGPRVMPLKFFRKFVKDVRRLVE